MPEAASSGRSVRTFDVWRSGRKAYQAAEKFDLWLPTEASGSVGGTFRHLPDG